jgi:2-methylcitrate dehydratase PrpD
MTDAGGQPAFAEVSFKPWCAARQTMAATQALCESLEGGIAADEIAEVTAAVLPPHFKMINHGVKAGDRASFMTSLPYQMAVALLEPEAQFALSAPSAMPSSALQSLMSRITVVADESLLPHYPAQWPARVSVVTSRGRQEKTIRDIPGDPARPMDEASLKAKFDRLVAPVLGEKTRAFWRTAIEAPAERPIDLVQQLDEIVSANSPPRH